MEEGPNECNSLGRSPTSDERDRHKQHGRIFKNNPLAMGNTGCPSATSNSNCNTEMPIWMRSRGLEHTRPTMPQTKQQTVTARTPIATRQPPAGSGNKRRNSDSDGTGYNAMAQRKKTSAVPGYTLQHSNKKESDGTTYFAEEFT